MSDKRPDSENRPTFEADGMSTDMLPSGAKITPQPAPTSPRIKDLLGRALTKPETLSAAEVQEMAASVVYHLIASKKT